MLARFRQRALWLAAAGVLLSRAAFADGEPEPEPQPPPPSQPEAFSSDEDPRIPIYQRARPEWAIELASSIKPLSSVTIHPEQSDGSVLRAFSLQVEYQPAFIQKFGVLGVGLGGSAYAFIPRSEGVTALPVWSVGGQARYQLRYFREQPIVPMVGYSGEYWVYHSPETDSRFVAHGLLAGGWLLLNVFDSKTAANFFVERGVARSYLVGEVRFLAANGSSNVSFKGNSFFFGLRFEM